MVTKHFLYNMIICRFDYLPLMQSDLKINTVQIFNASLAVYVRDESINVF